MADSFISDTEILKKNSDRSLPDLFLPDLYGLLIFSQSLHFDVTVSPLYANTLVLSDSSWTIIFNFIIYFLNWNLRDFHMFLFEFFR